MRYSLRHCAQLANRVLCLIVALTLMLALSPVAKQAFADDSVEDGTAGGSVAMTDPNSSDESNLSADQSAGHESGEGVGVDAESEDEDASAELGGDAQVENADAGDPSQVEEGWVPAEVADAEEQESTEGDADEDAAESDVDDVDLEESANSGRTYVISKNYVGGNFGTVTVISGYGSDKATLYPHAGDVVAFRTSPKTGYTLTRMSYTTASGKTVALKRVDGTGRAGTNSVYTFTMPSENVTLNATFEENHRTIVKDVIVQVAGKENYSSAGSVLALVNQERAAQGLASLKMDPDLQEAAMQRAAECSVMFDHTRPDGTLCFSVSPYVFAENIAGGPPSPSFVMEGWMNSSGHRSNILGDYETIGVGYFTGSDGITYWVQLFGFDRGLNANASGTKSVTRTIVADASVCPCGGKLILVDGSDGTKATMYPKVGDRVTFKAVPSSGWQLKSLNYTPALTGKKMALTKQGGSTYYFTMPNSETQINAVFVKQ